MPVWLRQAVMLFLLACCCRAQDVDAHTPAQGSENLIEERVRLSEILVATPQPYRPSQVAEVERKAEKLHADVKSGADFAEVAKRNSNGPSAAFGGDVGYFTRGNLAKSLAEAIFQMKVGEVSDVIRTKQGFVILKVTDHVTPSSQFRSSNSSPQSLEILTNTLGVDFGPYLASNVLPTVRKNWYALIPESASKKKGKVVIEFAILKNGSVATQRVVGSSGDVALDRPAYGAIAASNPFLPLPSEFKGPSLGLRFSFYYNSGPGIQITPHDTTVPVGGSVQFSISLKDRPVSWSVRGPSCEASSCGTISPTGLYTAPQSVPTPAQVTVVVSPISDISETARATVTIVPRDAPR